MRGRRGVSKQDNILVAPTLAQDTIEVEPGRTAQVARVRHQFMTAEIASKDFLAGRNRLLGAHLPEAGSAPGLFRALNDESGGVAVELVGVRPDPAVLGLLEDESKRIVEFLMRAEPNVLASTHVDVRLEHVGMGGAYPRIHPVGADDQIVVRIGGNVRGFGLELELDPEGACPLLKNIQQAF